MTANNSDTQQSWSLARSIKAVLLLQTAAAGVLLLATAIFGFYSLGRNIDALCLDMAAVIFGSFLAIIATMLTARSVRRASPADRTSTGPGRAPVTMVPIFSGLLNKLVIVGGGIAFGLIVWELNPILVVLSYLVVQISAAGHFLQSSIEK